MILHNRQFANLKSLKIFKDFVVQGQEQGLEFQGQGLANWSSRTRTFPEDYNTGKHVCVRLREGSQNMYHTCTCCSLILIASRYTVCHKIMPLRVGISKFYSVVS